MISYKDHCPHCGSAAIILEEDSYGNLRSCIICGWCEYIDDVLPPKKTTKDGYHRKRQ